MLHIGMEHQRDQAKAKGARRQEILKKIKRLQGKLKDMPQSKRGTEGSPIPSTGTRAS